MPGDKRRITASAPSALILRTVDGELLESNPPRVLAQVQRFMWTELSVAEGQQRSTPDSAPIASGHARPAMTREFESRPTMAVLLAPKFNEQRIGDRAGSRAIAIRC